MAGDGDRDVHDRLAIYRNFIAVHNNIHFAIGRSFFGYNDLFRFFVLIAVLRKSYTGQQ